MRATYVSFVFRHLRYVRAFPCMHTAVPVFDCFDAKKNIKAVFVCTSTPHLSEASSALRHEEIAARHERTQKQTHFDVRSPHSLRK